MGHSCEYFQWQTATRRRRRRFAEVKKHTIFFSKIVLSSGLDLCSAGVPAGFLEKIVKMIARLLGKLSLCVVIIEDCGSCAVRGGMELAGMGVDTILAML